MHARKVLTVLVAVGMLVPAASAAPSLQTADAPTPNQQGDATATASGSSSGGSTGTTVANYTRLYVDDQYRHLELKPGQRDSMTVTVENGEDHAVSLSPHLVVPGLGERPIAESWVTIEAGDATLAAGEEREFEISVAVPENAELANYQGAIAFTNETITYPGRPAQPVHAASLAVRVYEDPTVHVREGDHGHSQVRAGDSYTHSIVIENTGDSAVPVNPTLTNQPRVVHSAGREQQTLERSWIEFEAPSEIAPGETVTVNVTISPPADVAVGDYNLDVDLGLKDAARREGNNYWQQVHVSFQVWTQPEEPFETSFRVSEETNSVTLTLDTNGRQLQGQSEAPSFDVSFVGPDGTVVDAERTQVSKNGYVDLAGSAESSGDAPYADRGSQRTFTYRLDDPATGDWSLRIMPENAIQLGYEIVRDEG